MAHVEAHNWREGLSLLQRIKYMMEGQYACDVTLKVGQGRSQETIKAHRFILVAGSPYFETHLVNQGPLVCSDIQPDVMKQIIRFLYSEEINIKPGNVLDVLSASKKFQIQQLTKCCSLYLEENLKPENVCTILTQSLAHNETKLTDKCTALISKHAKPVLKSVEFTSMSQAALLKVVKSNMLNGVTEMEVFTACVKWADRQCRDCGREVTDDSRRNVLGSVLFFIRFTSMSYAEFAEVAGGSSLIKSNEQALIHNYIALSNVPSKRPDVKPFTALTRQYVIDSGHGRRESHYGHGGDTTDNFDDFDPPPHLMSPQDNATLHRTSSLEEIHRRKTGRKTLSRTESMQARKH